MAGLLEKAYEKVWRRVGGRPWTEIIRDEQKASPLAFLLVFLGLGMVTGRLAWGHWWQMLLGLLLGILFGHFWW